MNAHSNRTRRLALAGLCFGLLAPCAHAQEFGVQAGPLEGDQQHSYSWSIDYFEGFGQYLEGSISWLNEGHIPDHHRDGQTVQLWARLPFDDNRFSFALGAGPYRYFDTEQAAQGFGYSNTHGWGAVSSARVSYYTARRWVASLELNHIGVTRGPSTTALLFGLAYQLDAPTTRGPRDAAVPRNGLVTHNEITLMAGETILNSLQSQTSLAESIEYRRGLLPYLDITAGYLHEGNGLVARRDGLTTELWLTRAFLNDTVTLAAGAGLYASVRHVDGPHADTGGDGVLSGLVSISASYRIDAHWSARVTWNRVMTRYSKDTDVLMGGLGYRF